MAWRWYLDKPIRNGKCICCHIDGRRFPVGSCSRHTSERKQLMKDHYSKLAKRIREAAERGDIR